MPVGTRALARHPMHQVRISDSQVIARGSGSHVLSSRDEFNPSNVSSKLSQRCKAPLAAGVHGQVGFDLATRIWHLGAK
jgi:hypothetical protein